jgi:hypothetical protein
MHRVRHPDGTISDVVNLTRAKGGPGLKRLTLG